MRLKFINIILVTFFVNTSFAQNEVELKLTHDSIRIGDQLRLDLSFYTINNDSLTPNWPEFDDYLTDEIEIIEKGKLQKILLDSISQKVQYIQQYILTSFEIGSQTIPKIEIEYADSNYYSFPTILFVSTVAIDTTKGIYDNKPIFEVDYTLSQQVNDWLKEYWYWLIIAVLVIILLFVLYKYKNREKIIIEIPKPKIPAHVSALSVLKTLEKNKAWEGDDKKKYYSSVTDTIRKYLEERFDILALEKTTVEIIKDLKYNDIISKDKFFLQEILKQADLVKFAKFKPDANDGEVVLNKSIEFVERTKSEIDNTKKIDLKND